jgi:hypothetical protein
MKFTKKNWKSGVLIKQNDESQMIIVIGDSFKEDKENGKIAKGNFNIENIIIVQLTIERRIIGYPLFHGIKSVMVHPGFICWGKIFNQNKKNKIRANIVKYIYKTNNYEIETRNQIMYIDRKLKMLGGMFEEPQDFFMVEDTIIEFDFIEQFVFNTNNDIAWVRMAEEVPDPVIHDEHIVRFIPTPEINGHVREETERLFRNDNRYQEDIVRDEQVVSPEQNIGQIISNMGSLASGAENMATVNVNWDAREPFNLLRNIFEFSTNGWKETLVTAFRDRVVRINIFKNFSMRLEMSICSSNNLLEAIINGGR